MDNKLQNHLTVEVERGGRAYVRNLVAAERAVIAGRFNVAKVLRAAAHSQRVMAMEAARLLEDQPTDEELLHTILDELKDSSIDNFSRIQERLRDIVQRSLDSLQDNADVLESDVAQHLSGCYGCGAILESEPPHSCPVCGALRAEFEWFGPFYSSTPEHLGQLKPEAILTILERIPDEVEAVVSQVDDDVLRQKPSPDEWCPAEIIGHILETDKLFAMRARTLLESQGAELPRPMPPWKLHEGKGYESMPVSDLMKHLRDVRQHTLDLLRPITAADWSRIGQLSGTATSMLDLGTWLANHDRGHLAQIKRLCGV